MNEFEKNQNISEEEILEVIPEISTENQEINALKEENSDNVQMSQSNPYVGGYNFYSENIKSKKKKRMWVGVLAGILAGVLLSASAFSIILVKNGLVKLPFISDDKNGLLHESENSFEFSRLTDDSREPKSLVEIAAEVGPSVVMVTTTSTVSSFLGNTIQQGSGSGIVVSADGYIITNNHVIENTQVVKVKLSDGTEYAANVIGSDQKTDIAVLKIDGTSNLSVAVMGDSDKIQVGELAVAIGNPLGTQLTGTVTQGVISAVNRTVESINNTYVNLIQTDAAINSGNSGGALVNGYGEIIGVNTVKYAASGVEGIGFAIPVNDVMPIVDDLIENGYVRGRPLIGINIIEVNEQLSAYNNIPVGLYVANVEPGSAADMGGIKAGDVITKADGKEVKTRDELNGIRDTKKVGEVLVFEVYRNGKNIEVSIILQEDKSAINQ